MKRDIAIKSCIIVGTNLGNSLGNQGGISNLILPKGVGGNIQSRLTKGGGRGFDWQTKLFERDRDSGKEIPR